MGPHLGSGSEHQAGMSKLSIKHTSAIPSSELLADLKIFYTKGYLSCFTTAFFLTVEVVGQVILW